MLCVFGFSVQTNTIRSDFHEQVGIDTQGLFLEVLGRLAAATLDQFDHLSDDVYRNPVVLRNLIAGPAQAHSPMKDLFLGKPKDFVHRNVSHDYTVISNATTKLKVQDTEGVVT